MLVYNLAVQDATPQECAVKLNKAYSEWLKWYPEAEVLNVQPCLAAWGNANNYTRDHGFAMSITITYYVRNNAKN